ETQRYINDTEWMLTYESTEVIVNSNYMKRELQRLFGLPFEKINVAPNGININMFNGVEKDYEFRRQYALDNEKIILFMGRLVYEKGVQHLISAMPKILSGYHDAKLIIAGKGGMLEELKAQVASMGLGNKVYFTGYMDQKQVCKMYKCADISVFPSTYEPFGIVALEAMLSGTPVVVSDIGGLNEIVEHGVDGMKSYAGNANSLADSILELLYNPALADSVVKKARLKVKNEYNWAKIAQDTHFIYQKAICQTMAERQKNQIAQEQAKKAKKAKNTEAEITNLLSFRKRQAYA
ncbi:MAG: glycosyltransferase family 4 protein, partial [Clostridia bacterium]|nr:glycosyltransferase family 4 protein [Clostridia bacterium]